jgi:glycosyltransferase involved in cell wall biosynthesis
MGERRPGWKIALVSAFYAQDNPQVSWHGIIAHMIRALQTHCGEVTVLGPVQCRERSLARARAKATHILLKRNFQPYHCFLVARRYGHIFAQRLQDQAFDVVFAPAAATEIAFLESELPIVLVEDATYGQLIGNYTEYTHLLKHSVAEMQAIEQLAQGKARATISASGWAARAAIDNYHTDPRQVHVAPFGAVLDHPPSRDVALARRKSDQCRLLFVGLRWERKGGEIAYETLLALRKMGVDAELTVVGCVPPLTCRHEAMRIFPFLDKADESQRRQLEELYASADFFLLPTRSEAYGVVFCEASAYGLPSVAAACGGVPEVVRDGENGYVLPLDARGDAYAELIARVHRDDARYYELVRSTRAAYETRLNWDAWGETVRGILEEILNPSASRAHA